VEIWRDLSLREASRDNSAVDISWLGRSRATLPRGQTLRDQLHRLQPPPAEIAGAAAPPNVSIAATEHVASDDAPSAPAMDVTSQLTSDLAATIAERYPLLRNAM
jgi:hypothetical protein